MLRTHGRVVIKRIEVRCHDQVSLARHAASLLADFRIARVDSGLQAQTEPLSLDEAIDQALDETPQLAASVATLEAAEAVAPSAGRLPDPELVAAVDNLPINTDERFSFTTTS